MDGYDDVPGAGFLEIDGIDASAYAGLTIYLQATLGDPGAVHGVSLSNALQLTIHR